MPGQMRPDKKVMKIAYEILQTPKKLQQKADPDPSQKRQEAWKINDSLNPRYA